MPFTPIFLDAAARIAKALIPGEYGSGEKLVGHTIR